MAAIDPNWNKLTEEQRSHIRKAAQIYSEPGPLSGPEEIASEMFYAVAEAINATAQRESKPPQAQSCYPKELTSVLQDVLGLMIMQTCPIAHALREAGENIPRKTEAEQAYVLHWMISLALEHGEGWREKVGERLHHIAKVMKANADTRQST